jgi:hypothetical protein
MVRTLGEQLLLIRSTLSQNSLAARPGKATQHAQQQQQQQTATSVLQFNATDGKTTQAEQDQFYNLWRVESQILRLERVRAFWPKIKESLEP